MEAEEDAIEVNLFIFSFLRQSSLKRNLPNTMGNTTFFFYCGNSTIFIRNYPTKYLSPLYSNNHYVDYQYFFEFYNSYVLDLARFEDHTFAFFKGKC